MLNLNPDYRSILHLLHLCTDPQTTVLEDIRLIPAGFVNENYGPAATTTNPEVFWAKP